jgi:hypothetical protein
MLRQMDISLHRRDVCILMVLVTLTLALRIPFVGMEQLRDGLYWARIVENGDDMYAILNPHHLGYLPANVILLNTITLAGAARSGITAGVVHSVIGAGVLTIVMYLLGRQVSGSRAVGVILSLTLGASQVSWVFSTQVAPYVPLLASLGLLSYSLVLSHKSRNFASRVLLPAIAFAVAIYYHQAAVLLSVPIVVYFLSLRGSAGLKDVGWVLSISAGMVLAGYVAAYFTLYDELSVKSFLTYCTRYASIPDPSFSTFSNYNPSAFALLIQQQFEAFLIAPWGVRGLAYWIFGLSLATLLLWHVWRGFKRAPFAALRLFSASWIITYLCFYLWAVPAEKEPLSFNFVPILLLVALVVVDVKDKTPSWSRRAATLAAFAFVVGMGFKNFREVILPMSQDFGKEHAIAKDLVGVLPKRCAIFHQDQLVLQNLYYYFSGKWSDLRDLWDLTTYFFYGEGKPIPFTWQNFEFREDTCYVVPVSMVAPTTRIRLKSGNELGKEWLEYVEWLFGIALQEGAVSARTYSIMVDARGRAYFVIGGGHETVSDISAWLMDMDGRISSATYTPSSSFSNWVRENEEVLEGHLVGGERSRTLEKQ